MILISAYKNSKKTIVLFLKVIQALILFGILEVEISLKFFLRCSKLDNNKSNNRIYRPLRCFIL
jgi:hypothetical protein